MCYCDLVPFRLYSYVLPWLFAMCDRSLKPVAKTFENESSNHRSIMPLRLNPNCDLMIRRIMVPDCNKNNKCQVDTIKKYEMDLKMGVQAMTMFTTNFSVLWLAHMSNMSIMPQHLLESTGLHCHKVSISNRYFVIVPLNNLLRSLK